MKDKSSKAAEHTFERGLLGDLGEAPGRVRLLIRDEAHVHDHLRLQHNVLDRDRHADGT